MPESLRVLFLAAEAEPFIKVGGLGDVAGSLPRYLRNLDPERTGEAAPDVRLVLPLHSVLKTDRHGLQPLLVYSVPHARGAIRVQVLTSESGGLPVYFLDAAPVSNSGSVYSSDAELDGEKYTFFPLAALELSRHLDWQPQILHANDWHTALACYALLLRRRQGELPGLTSILTIHNLQYMGPDVSESLREYGLEPVHTGLPEWANGKPLALGIWGADVLAAVSPSYAREIQTPAFGCGLEDYLRARRDSLNGILNGIDYDAYNPALDPALAANYGLPTLERRAVNKAALQVRLGLSPSPNVPLLGVVSRMDPQKGMDVISGALKRIRDLQWQAVILGTGLPRLERAMQRLQNEFPERVRVELKYDAGLARQIYAGADVFLMPSRQEPCGLAQMIAMRYGCVPIVSAVGGLKDTIFDGETGFVLPAPTSTRLANGIKRALEVLGDPQRWVTMQKAGMSQDFSWEISARQYMSLYQRMLAQIQASHIPS